MEKTKNEATMEAPVNEKAIRSETAQEMAERLQKEFDEYAAMIDKVDSQEELDKLESELMVEMDKYDSYISGRTYNLPEEVVFEGKSYTKSAVAGKIIYFISKIEQTWQYVMGLYELCRLWKNPDFNEITFGALDSTLRLLDQTKYQGMTEWRDILIVNEYVKPLHEDYAKDTTMQIALAKKHNEIIKRRDLIDPVKQVPHAEKPE
jgi:hypothetical protein